LRYRSLTAEYPATVATTWEISFQRAQEEKPAAADLLLPVGISFFVFRSLTYSIDFYRGDVEEEPNFIRYASLAAPNDPGYNEIDSMDTDAYFQDLARIFGLPESEGGLECRDALALDGGGSAQMYAEYKSLKIDIPGGWAIPNGIGVFKKQP
jgi:hypothetical protein